MADAFDEAQVNAPSAKADVRQNALLLTAAAEVAGAAAALIDPDELIRRAIHLIADCFGIYFVAAFLIDETGQWAVLREAAGDARRKLKESGFRIEIGGATTVARAIAAGRPQIVRGAPPANSILSETRAEIAVPLAARGQVFGALDLHSADESAFDDQFSLALQGMADQIALALFNARLFAAERRRAAEATIVSNALRALNTHFDLAETFRVVAAGLRDLTGCARVGLILLDPDGDSFTFAAVDESAPGLEHGARLPLASTAAAADLLAGRPHLTPDLAAECDLPADRAVYEAGYRSRVNVPLLVGDHVIGALDLSWREAGAFDPAHLPLLSQIADVVALAVQNLTLFESVARERSRLELVSMISQELSANLDLRAVAENALRLVTGTLDAFAGSLARTAVFVAEPGSDRLTLMASTGIPPERLAEIDQMADLRIGQGLVGWAAEHRRLAIAQDVTLDDRWRFVPGVDEGVRSSAAVPLVAGAELVGVLSLSSTAPAAFPPENQPLLLALAAPLALALQNARSFAAERGRVRTLTIRNEVSRALAASMNLDDLLPAVTNHLAAIVEATSAAIMLWDADRRAVTPAAGVSQATAHYADLRPGPGEPSLAEHVILNGQPVVVDDVSRTPLIGPDLAVLIPDKSLLALPLIARGRPVGVAFIGEDRHRRRFSPEEIDRAIGIAGQIALAIDNAQLFNSLGRQLSQIMEMKQLQDSVFASIAAGVITTEADGRVGLVNPAAERILGLPAVALVGQPSEAVLAFLGESVLALARDVQTQGFAEIGHEVTANFPRRGTVHLNVSLTPLKGADGRGAGVTFVLEDVTEQRRLEDEREHVRRTFERVVPSGVVENLLADSANLLLGGQRQEITVLFADVRGFTAFAEHATPEALIDVLNAFLTVAAQAVLDQGGTLDKFLGDGVMALFNAPLPQPSHTRHAVRAAAQMREALEPHRNLLDKTVPFKFSVGIAVGQAVVGNIGTAALFNYTAVGDTVNLAKRLQESAAPGQILLNEAAFQYVCDDVEARPLPPLRVKGRTALEQTYEVIRAERKIIG